MQSRKDHVQAYQFSVGRLVRAVTAGDASAGEIPFRRSNLGVTIGTILAVLLSGGAVVFGLIRPTASTAWRANGSIVVEKESGTRYLYLNGRLYPTANYASALLAAGSNASVQYVARADLSGVPVGATLGIDGAPDDLPPSASLLPGTWAVCLRPSGSAVLELAPSGYTAAAALSHQRVLVASTDTADPAEYVVWGSVKYPLPEQDVLVALGLADQQPIPAAPTWLDALPTGASLVPATIPDDGARGREVAGGGADIGAVFRTSVGGADQYYVPAVRRSGPDHRDRGRAVLGGRIRRAGGGLRRTDRRGARLREPFADQPAAGPPVRTRCTAAAPPCARCRPRRGPWPGRRWSPRRRRRSRPTPRSRSLRAGACSRRRPPPPRPRRNQGSGNAAAVLITDSGERYLIDSSTAQTALGYGSVKAVVVPAPILDLAPAGPILDSGAAKQAVTR